MIIYRIFLLFLFGFSSLAVNADGIYKWVDDKGQTHYGNVVPESHKKVAKKMETEPTNTSESSMNITRTDSVQETDQASNEISLSSTLEANKVGNVVSSEAECKHKWERYLKSQECFAPYRTASGTIKAEAFQHCAEIKEPERCY